MPKKSWGVNPKVEAARERDESRKEAEKQSKKKAADDALWADEANNKNAQKKAEEDRKRAVEAEKRALLKALEAKEAAELEKKRPPPKVTAATVYKIRSLEEINAEKRRAEDELKKSRIIILPDEIAPNANLRKVDIEAQPSAAASVAVDARSLSAAVDQLSLIGGGKEAEQHPERRMKAAFAAFEEREMPAMRADSPGLKLSQLREKLFKVWQKHPENPLVIAAAEKAAVALSGKAAAR